jgi:hypothetical protein
MMQQVDLQVLKADIGRGLADLSEGRVHDLGVLGIVVCGRRLLINLQSDRSWNRPGHEYR